jgi:simple sugar transport system ATP-binding protein
VSANPVPRLKLENICKSWGSLQALCNISFDINPGEVVGLLGDNGAGKSTLIKTLSGVFRPSSGRILWEGEAVHLTDPRKAMELGISVVFQDLAVVPMMSIYRNFFLGREDAVSIKVAGITVMQKAKAQKLAREALSDVGIHIRDVTVPVSTLSGGERQSISIARAVHFQSKLLILDEPTAALSLKETDKVLRYVDEARRKGVSVILITHNIGHAWSACDRFVVLYHGAIADIASKEEVTQHELANLINMGDRHNHAVH